MKKTLLLLLVISFFSCNNQSEKNLLLFNNVSFALLQNEKISNITSIEKDKFFSHFNEQAQQIPMYKCIKGDAYTVYIALPFNTTIQELCAADFIVCDQDVLTPIEASEYYYKKYKCVDRFVSEYAISIDNNIVYVLATTSLESVADSLFSYEAIKNRFVIK